MWAVMLGFCQAMCAQDAADDAWHCPAKAVEPCFEHHGRLAVSNGSGLTIWMIGTTRRVRVENELATPSLKKYLSMTSDDESFIYGDFKVCPLERDKPGHMRSACHGSEEAGRSAAAKFQTSIQAPIDPARAQEMSQSHSPELLEDRR
jgi:hypothetical protein